MERQPTALSLARATLRLSLHRGRILQSRPSTAAFTNEQGEPRMKRLICFVALTVSLITASLLLTPKVSAITYGFVDSNNTFSTVSYTHLRAHETPEHLVCR